MQQYFQPRVFFRFLLFFAFYYKFCIGSTRTEKKYVKKIDDDICNRKSEIMKNNRNYKEMDKKIWRVLKYKEIQKIRIWKLLFPSVETYFSCKLLYLQRETPLPLSRNKFLLSIGASLVGKAGFSIAHGIMRHIFQQSKIKITNQYLILVMRKDYQRRKNYFFFFFHFFRKVEPSGRLILIKNLYWNRFFVQQICLAEITSSYVQHPLLCLVETSY